VTSEFANLLLNWYAEHARDLPWRGRIDPYAIWVSEIMLQQTRVETVIPYFERWMAGFPTVFDLAHASQQDVLTDWEGLGYYSRARNLHRAAQIVVDDYSGELPADLKTLMKLPGIGRYTAGAIASIAFARDEPALDGNIRRVLARIFDVSVPTRSKEGESRLWELAAEHLPTGRAGTYNQALMDLGATICTPRSPGCEHCPLARICQACILGLQAERPVTVVKAAIPHHTVASAVIRRDGMSLIAQRPENGLLGGMWEFPGGNLNAGEELAYCLKREIEEQLGVNLQIGQELGVFHHAYTHFRVTVHAYACTLQNGNEPINRGHQALKWVSYGEMTKYPMGKIDRQIALRLAKDKETNDSLE
jgi:A/G-specific adenine glycosylase